jgi:hypothetical protein
VENSSIPSKSGIFQRENGVDLVRLAFVIVMKQKDDGAANTTRATEYMEATFHPTQYYVHTK